MKFSIKDFFSKCDQIRSVPNTEGTETSDSEKTPLRVGFDKLGN